MPLLSHKLRIYSYHPYRVTNVWLYSKHKTGAAMYVGVSGHCVPCPVSALASYPSECRGEQAFPSTSIIFYLSASSFISFLGPFALILLLTLMNKYTIDSLQLQQVSAVLTRGNAVCKPKLSNIYI
jgi:hypothetical protein